jgi:hypothetical protein
MRYSEIVQLNEYSREVTAQKLGASLLQKFQKEPPQWQTRIVGDTGNNDRATLDRLLASVEQADPTKNKQYVPWIIRTYVNSPSLKFEDAVSKVNEPLKKFFKLVSKKQIPAPNNDIGRIKDLATLVQTVDQYPDIEDQPKDVDRGQALEVYKDADLRIIEPIDQTAACYYGQGTKWCTAAKQNNMFYRYDKEGKLYIIIPTKPAHAGEKYQFHFPTKQFMDEKDHRASLIELRSRFPQLADIFAKQAAEFNILALRKDITDLNATMQQALPVFRGTLKSMIDQQSKATAKEITMELGKAVRALRGSDEIWELSEDMFDADSVSVKLANMAANIVADDPDVASDEDQLYDLISNDITEIVRDTELWIYITELLEELEDEEAEFDAAMTIEGELNSMLQKLIPEAFSQAINAGKQAGVSQ